MTKLEAQILTTDVDVDAAIAGAAPREPYRPKAIAASYRAAEDFALRRPSRDPRATTARRPR